MHENTYICPWWMLHTIPCLFFPGYQSSATRHWTLVVLLFLAVLFLCAILVISSFHSTSPTAVCSTLEGKSLEDAMGWGKIGTPPPLHATHCVLLVLILLLGLFDLITWPAHMKMISQSELILLYIAIWHPVLLFFACQVCSAMWTWLRKAEGLERGSHLGGDNLLLLSGDVWNRSIQSNMPILLKNEKLLCYCNLNLVLQIFNI